TSLAMPVGRGRKSRSICRTANHSSCASIQPLRSFGRAAWDYTSSKRERAEPTAALPAAGVPSRDRADGCTVGRRQMNRLHVLALIVMTGVGACLTQRPSEAPPPTENSAAASAATASKTSKKGSRQAVAELRTAERHILRAITMCGAAWFERERGPLRAKVNAHID